MELNQRDVEDVVVTVFKFFDSLPKKGKPNGCNEWTTLSAFVIKTTDETIVASLATGTRCLGQGLVDIHGRRLHDSHSEILSRRAFQRYLMSHIEHALSGNDSKFFKINNENGKLYRKEQFQVIFVTTHTPCGDASIFKRPEGDIHPNKRRKLDEASDSSTSNSSDVERLLVNTDSYVEDIYRTGAKCVHGGPQDTFEPGKNYHVTEVLRIKPGRGDRTQSLSCSDKMARWNILGCQGCLPMLFLHSPIYIDVVITAGCAYDTLALSRALNRRLKDVCVDESDYHINQPSLQFSSMTFQHSKKQIEANSSSKITPCAASLICYKKTCDTLCLEVAINGYKQGITKKALGTPSAWLSISRYKILQSIHDIINNLPKEKQHLYVQGSLLPKTYQEWKELTTYTKVWRKLKSVPGL